MGTDMKYSNPNMGKSYYTPEELSAEVLKELKKPITDEVVNSVVITVPAMFDAMQKDATLKAAEIAGFKQCKLLQEPIAACMAYGLTSKEKDGCWLVFDFGGGTFDAALVRVEDGILTVFDTEGDNYLGGKNLDEAFIDQIIIPHLKKEYALNSFESVDWKRKALCDGLKGPAEEMRIALSFDETTDYSTYDRNLDLGIDDNGENIDLEITVDREQLSAVLKPLYQKAIDACRELLKRNNLTGDSITSLILVGGPTYSPIVREMLVKQITKNVDTSINPMTAVARGAALFASTCDATIDEAAIKNEACKNVVFLNVVYEATSVEKSEWVSMAIDEAKTGSMCPAELTVDIARADGAWRSDKIKIDKAGNVIEAFLVSGAPNNFKINAYDNYGSHVTVFPTEFTIIPNIKIGAAPLPYNIGIEVYNNNKQRGVFEALKGLEKNKPLPAVGVSRTLKTRNQLRPGVSNDIVNIPVYQAPFDGTGKTAAACKYIASVKVSGDDVNQMVPIGSEVVVTLHVKSSENMFLEVYFPAFDLTIKRDLELSRINLEEQSDWVDKTLQTAKASLANLKAAGVNTAKLEAQLQEIAQEHTKGTDVAKVSSHLKEVLLKIDDLDNGTEWQRIEDELREQFERLEKAQHDLGDSETQQAVNQLRSQVDQVIRIKDVSAGREVLEQIRGLFVQLTLLYQCMGCIEHYNSTFSSHSWKDANRARQLINRGLEAITNNPSTETLLPITRGILELLNEQPKPGEPGVEGLLRG